MNTRTHRTLRGEAATAYLEAKALLAALGPDPDAAQHRADLAHALAAPSAQFQGNEAHAVNRIRTPRRRAADVAEDVEFILATDPTATTTQIGHRLGMDRNHITKALERAGRDDLRTRLAQNAAAA